MKINGVLNVKRFKRNAFISWIQHSRIIVFARVNDCRYVGPTDLYPSAFSLNCLKYRFSVEWIYCED